MTYLVELCIGLMDAQESSENNKRYQWDVVSVIFRDYLTKIQLRSSGGLYYKIIELLIIFKMPPKSA